MITAVDTNVLSALWSAQAGSAEGGQLLYQARQAGSLIVCGIVYAECMTNPFLQPEALEHALNAMGIGVEFSLGQEIWREAGRCYARYSERRRRSGGGEPKRLLADFVVGAHALVQADRLLTFDTARYRNDFPELMLVGEDAPREGRC